VPYVYWLKHKDANVSVGGALLACAFKTVLEVISIVKLK
jgi:hypothetical protein